jgi:hypothetical protein
LGGEGRNRDRASYLPHEQVLDRMAGWGLPTASEAKAGEQAEQKVSEAKETELRGMDAVRAIISGQNYFKVHLMPRDHPCIHTSVSSAGRSELALGP